MGSFLSDLQSLGNALPHTVSQGLIWGIMAIGLYITYKILEFSDLTVDGSFATGGIVCAVMMGNGYNVWVAMAAAFGAGMLAGWVTSFFHTKLGIPAILSGILTQLGLWSVNLSIAGMKPNLPLSFRKFDLLVNLRFLREVEKGSKPFYMHPIFTVGLITLGVIALLYWFFGTELGASIRATGANENMARAQGINTNRNKVLGLMIANGLVALAGSLLAQFNGAADVSMGKGAIVIGLAAIIIGEVTFGKLFKNFALKLLSASLGAIIYYVVIQSALTLMDIDSNYLNLISALIVALFLSIPTLRKNLFKTLKKSAKSPKNPE